jgi:hypothetical protein
MRIKFVSKIRTLRVMKEFAQLLCHFQVFSLQSAQCFIDFLTLEAHLYWAGELRGKEKEEEE